METAQNEKRIRTVLRKRSCTSCRGSGIGRYVRFLGEDVEQPCKDCLGNGQVLVAEPVTTTTGCA